MKSDETMAGVKRPWKKMELHYEGRIEEVVQQGGGKLTKTGGDPGEPRKQGPEH